MIFFYLTNEFFIYILFTESATKVKIFNATINDWMNELFKELSNRKF